MKKIYLAATVLISLASCFVTSCSNEDGLAGEESIVVKSTCEKIHERITVSRGASTRAAMGDDMSINFAEGDKLYLKAVDADGNVVGFCNMDMADESAVGTPMADFEGDLVFKTDATIAHRTYYLIGKDDCLYELKQVSELAAEEDSAYDWVDDEEAKTWNMPCGCKDMAVVETMTDAIAKYSALTYEDDVDSRSIGTVELSQQNVFLKSQLTFKSETRISAGDKLSIGCKCDEATSLPAEITTKAVGGDVVAEFVVPMSNNTFSHPQFIISKEGCVSLNVKFGKASNEVNRGTVYSVNKTVDSSMKLKLTKDMPVGTLGVVNGREAIVVDLGVPYGKVGIALMNEGATSIYRENGEYTNLGTRYNFQEAVELNDDKAFGEGWYLPTKEEFEALANLTDAEGNKVVKWNAEEVGLEWDFGTGKLFLQGYWYDDCRYWSCTSFDTTRNDYAYFLYSSGGKCEVGFNKSTFRYPLRLFCTLP